MLYEILTLVTLFSAVLFQASGFYNETVKKIKTKGTLSLEEAKIAKLDPEDIPEVLRDINFEESNHIHRVYSMEEDLSTNRVVIIWYKNRTSDTKYKNLCIALADTVKLEMNIGQTSQPDYYSLYKYTNSNGDTVNSNFNYYALLRGAVKAGCSNTLIIEHSFHTNPTSAAWLNVNSNLDQLAIEEAKAIVDQLKTW